MLTALRTGVYFRLSIFLTAFASLCFVAPPAAVAFGHGTATAHCMAHADTVDHGKIAAPIHTNHSGPARNHQPSCCGLFCMSALVNDGHAIEPIAVASAPFPVRERTFLSRGPERLDRPPISLVIV